MHRSVTSSGVFFTQHAEYKMREYRVSRQKVSSVMRRPDREEIGIAPNTIAVMQTAGSSKHSHEVWVMYQRKIKSQTSKSKNGDDEGLAGKLNFSSSGYGGVSHGVRIISVWRYPGKSPERDPIPEYILQGIEDAVLCGA